MSVQGNSRVHSEMINDGSGSLAPSCKHTCAAYPTLRNPVPPSRTMMRQLYSLSSSADRIYQWVPLPYCVYSIAGDQQDASFRDCQATGIGCGLSMPSTARIFSSAITTLDLGWANRDHMVCNIIWLYSYASFHYVSKCSNRSGISAPVV